MRIGALLAQHVHLGAAIQASPWSQKERSDVVFAPHVEAAAGMILPDD